MIRRDPQRRLARPWALAALAAAALLGCAEAGGLKEVSGEVLTGSEPLVSGSILFVPERESPGMSAQGAVISEGRFRIPASPGLSPGRYRVEILPAVVPGEPDPGGSVDPITGADVPLLGAPAASRRAKAVRPGRRRDFPAEVTESGPNTFRFDVGK